MTQPATIELTVDYDGEGSGTAATEEWSNFDRLSNRSVYHSDAHTPILRDTLTIYRTLPKPTPTFYGVQKSAVKLSMDVTVAIPNGETTRSPIIFELSASIPVGASSADVLKQEERIKGLIYNRDFMTRLFEKGEV